MDKSISKHSEVNWTEQLRILNEIADLITPRLSLEETIAVIYENVNQLTDAYQFCVGMDHVPQELFQQIHQRCIELGNVWRPEM